MSEKTWHEGGIYSRTRKRDGREQFYGRVWVPSQQRFAYFKLGMAPKKAERRMREIMGDPEKALAERARKRARVLTFAALLDEFLSKYRSRGGTRYYQNVMRAPRAHFGSRPVTGIDAAALDRYLAARREERTKERFRTVNGEKVKVGGGERRVSESTLRKEVISLGTVFRWAKRRGLVRENPVADYEKPKDPAERPIAVLSPEQEDALRATCPPWAWDVVEWALCSGMRRGEVLKLRWRDVDRARGVVHTASKTGRARTVPLNLSDELGAVLERRLRHVNSDLVFCERDGNPLDVDALNGVIEAAAKAAGIAKERGVMWNRFRHTWATRLAATGKVSLFEVSKWMGNSVAICERHYAAYLPASFERAAGLLNRPAGVAPTVAGNTSVS